MTLVCQRVQCGAEFASTHRRRRYCSQGCANITTGAIIEARNGTRDRTIVWSCGGGVDSTAVAVLICQGLLPRPDYAIMVDVGYEPETTWDYARTVLAPKLAEAGVLITILKTVDHGDNVLVKNDHLVIPAYRRKADGTIAKLGTRCSGPWKARVTKRWLRARGVRACEQWIGIAADETQRAKPDQNKWVRLRWPLIERGLDRAACVDLITSAGWPVPERTSCWMCPHRTTGDWRRLAARAPGDFQRAVRLELSLQRQFPDTFLHRSAVPLEVAVNGCEQHPSDEQRRLCNSTFSACM